MSFTKQSLMGYNRQLDGLRFFAVGFVLWEHWAFDKKIPGFNPGKFGVHLFFVLSGYLITGILLKAREKQQSKGALLKAFYARRFLRIFPLYYLVLSIVYVLDFSGIRAGVWWHLSYLTNFYGNHTLPAADWGLWAAAGHFWSLAVEEQFYLVWPFLLVFVPKRYLFWTIAGAGAVGCFSFFIAMYFGLSLGFWEVTPLGCLPLFAAGGLVNYINTWNLSRRNLVIFMLCSGLVYYVPRLLHRDVVLTNFFLTPFLAGIVLLAARGYRGLLGKVLENRIVVYLGTISYGIYLLHFFVGLGVKKMFENNGLNYAQSVGLGQTPILFAITIILASLLYFFFEKPVMKLKRYFEYTRDNKASFQPADAHTSVVTEAVI